MQVRQAVVGLQLDSLDLLGYRRLCLDLLGYRRDSSLGLLGSHVWTSLAIVTPMRHELAWPASCALSPDPQVP